MSRATYEPPGRVSPDRAVLGPATFPLELPRTLAPVARRAWRGAFVRRLVAGDAACALVAGTAALAMPGAPPTLLVALVLPLVWIAALFGARSYDRNVLCEGPDEYRRVLVGAGLVLAGVALYSWAGQQEVSRSFVAMSLPLATALTLRRTVGPARPPQPGADQGPVHADHPADRPPHRRRRAARPAPSPGGPRLPRHRLLPASSDSAGPPRAGLAVLGGLDDVVDVVRRFNVDTVAVLPTAELDGAALRRLGWGLEETRADLLLAPAVTDIAGPRVRIRPVCGLSLLHMGRPELRGARRVAKAVFDRTGAAALLVLVAPSCSRSPSS